MEFYTLTAMPWPDLPTDYDGDSWVLCPNELYDPQRGNELYRGHIDLLELADDLGFDGVGLIEHHQTAYCGTPSPNLMGAIAARVTKRAKILICGNALPLYPPLRVAEEWAMVDVISGGRLIAGMVVGDQPGYYSYNINTSEARARYSEAVNFILEAWTRPGPFEFNGEFYRYKFVNPWPRPIQQPHPPVWIPGIGSVETMEFCAQNNFTYVSLPFFHKGMTDDNYARFRRAWLEAGRDPDPSKLSLSLIVYVAETDAQARAEFEEHYWYITRLQKGIFPNAPGYMSERSVLRVMQLVQQGFMTSATTWEDVVAGGYLVVGSPSTVADQLADRLRVTGAGNLVMFLQHGSLPLDLAAKNYRLFAEEVMPLLKKEYPNGPAWAESAATV